jgi:excisionase family DNA binding protein
MTAEPRSPTASNPPRLHTAQQAADLLQVPVSWLRKKATARAIPCTFIGKHLRFSPADLTAIINAGTRPATRHDHRH